MRIKKCPCNGKITGAVRKDNNNNLDVTTSYAICQFSMEIAKKIREYNTTFEASQWLADILVKLGLAVFMDEGFKEEW